MDHFTTQDPPTPTPLNSCYGNHDHVHDHDHIIHHNHDPSAMVNGCSSQLPPSQMEAVFHHRNNNDNNNNNNNNNKKHVKYKECLKNHAASIGGRATDGCCEFMPSGEEGSIQALTCSACNCHRNFHRKEIDGEPYDWLHDPRRLGSKLLVGGNSMITPAEAAAFAAYPTSSFISSRSAGVVGAQPQRMIMPFNNMVGGTGSEYSELGRGGRGYSAGKKRYRTKFTGEQKEKMVRFAEKAGWKIEKEEESVVKQLCEEIGVNRKVLKVWMHNNKHNINLSNKHNNNI